MDQHQQACEPAGYDNGGDDERESHSRTPGRGASHRGPLFSGWSRTTLPPTFGPTRPPAKPVIRRGSEHRTRNAGSQSGPPRQRRTQHEAQQMTSDARRIATPRLWMVYKFLPDHRGTAGCRLRLVLLAQRAAQNDASAARRTAHRTGDMCVEHHKRMCADMARLAAFTW